MDEKTVSISNVPTDRYMKLVAEHRKMMALLQRVLSAPGKNGHAKIFNAQKNILLMQEIADTLNEVQNAFYLAEPQPVRKVGQIMGIDVLQCDWMPENEMWVRHGYDGNRLIKILIDEQGKFHTDVA